jgi:hypothetical protein
MCWVMRRRAVECTKEVFMSFAIYVVGFIIMLGGLMWGAHLMHIPSQWIAVGGIFFLGIGIFTAVKNTRQRDPS